jgi:Tfp pilus assembly pilus retraction ATPase PilT
MRIDGLVSNLLQRNGSDLQLKVGAPAVRVRGLLDYLEGYEVLRPMDTEELLKEIIPQNLVGELEEELGAAPDQQGAEEAQFGLRGALAI